jgi:putative nucleotidyltransferase with HDIG domain
MKILRLRRLRKKGMSSSVSRKTEEQRRVRNLLNTSIIVKGTIGFTVFALSVMCITLFERYRDLGVTEGFNADVDYYNSFEFKYPDVERTMQKRLEVVSMIPDIYRFEENELERDLSTIVSNVRQWLEDRKALESGETPPTEEALNRLRDACEKRIRKDVPRLTEEDVSLITSLDKPLEGMQKTKEVLEGFLDNKLTLSNARIPTSSLAITPKKFTEIENEIVQAVENAFNDTPDKEKKKLLEIPFFFVNRRHINRLYIYDDARTKELLQKAAEQSIETEYKKVTRGSTIVHRGRRIRREHLVQLMENLERSEDSKPRSEKALFHLGISAIVAVLLILFGSYLRFYQPHIFSSNARLAAIGTIVILTLVFSKVFIQLKFIHPFFDYPVFVSFGAVLVSLMFGMNPAFVTSFIVAMIVGVMFDFRLSHGFLALTSGMAAAYFAGNVSRRSELVKVSLMIGGVSFVTVFAVSVAENMGIVLTQLWQCFGGFMYAVIGTALATIALPVFEYVFRITTNISLMELTDTKNPLLRRLIMEAPGTYHHSLVVGNLVEAAAERIEANALLGRVASYYHDIGKLKKPAYFSENERLSKSKHDSLIPSMSSLIIVSHVKDGVDLAIKHKLPREIVDIIRQHHGTNLVYYFYKRATEMGNEVEPVNESDFRYPGPKPRSREAAIAMLADSVEAASRSLERVSSSKVGTLVHDIITSKFEDGQLDECDLTLMNLHTIEETFVHILMGSLHQRVKYPKKGETALPPNGETNEAGNDRVAEQPKVVKH